MITRACANYLPAGRPHLCHHVVRSKRTFNGAAGFTAVKDAQQSSHHVLMFCSNLTERGCRSCSSAHGCRCDPWVLLKPETDPGYTYDCQTNRMMGPRTAQYRYRSRLDRCLCRHKRQCRLRCSPAQQAHPALPEGIVIDDRHTKPGAHQVGCQNLLKLLLAPMLAGCGAGCLSGGRSASRWSAISASLE